MEKAVELSQLKCMVCMKRIDAVRIRRNRSNTCSKECHKKYQTELKAISTVNNCEVCHRPSSPAERAAFLRFRRIEEQFADILYPRLYKAHTEAGGTRETFLDEITNRPRFSPPKLVVETRAGLEENRADVVAVLTGGVPARHEVEAVESVPAEMQDSDDERDSADGAGAV